MIVCIPENLTKAELAKRLGVKEDLIKIEDCDLFCTWSEPSDYQGFFKGRALTAEEQKKAMYRAFHSETLYNCIDEMVAYYTEHGDEYSDDEIVFD